MCVSVCVRVCACVCVCVRGEYANLGAGVRVFCSVFRAPREYEGGEYGEYSRTRPNTAEYVSSRALVGIQEYVLRF